MWHLHLLYVPKSLKIYKGASLYQLLISADVTHTSSVLLGIRLDLVGLLDTDADADAVDAGLDEDTLVLVPGDGQGIQQNLGGGLSFNLGYIMTLGDLGGEIGQA